MVLTATGDAPVSMPSSSRVLLVSLATGLAPVSMSSSSRAILVSLATGLAPVSMSSSSRVTLVSVTTGSAPVSEESSSISYLSHDMEADSGELSEISIPIELSGILDPIFPAPSPPVDFVGLPDPTEAPTLTQSDTVGGYLPLGTYRYRYAAWKGSPAQATAPSPSSDITLSSEGVLPIHTWVPEDASGPDTSQPNTPYGFWKQIGTWTPTESGILTLPAPVDDGASNEIDYIIYDATNIHSWGIWDSYGYHYPSRPLGSWYEHDSTESFEAGVDYVLAVYVYEEDEYPAVGRSTNFEAFVQAVQEFGDPIITAGEMQTSSAITLTYPTIPGADGYLVYREEL